MSTLNQQRLKTQHELLPKEKISQSIADKSTEQVPSSSVVHKEHNEKAHVGHLHDERYLKLSDKADRNEYLSGTDDVHWIHSKAAMELFLSLLAKTQTVVGRWTFEDLLVRNKSGKKSAEINLSGAGTAPTDAVATINATNTVTSEVHSLAITTNGDIQFNGRSIAMFDAVLPRDGTAVNSEALGGDLSFKWQSMSKGMLPFPTGGRLEYQGAINAPLCIVLPDNVSTLYGMSVVIYQTAVDKKTSTILHLNGYYDENSNEWSSTDAYLANDTDDIKIEFGRTAAGKPAIWLSNPDKSWNNPMLTVMNLSVSRPEVRNVDWYANGIKVVYDESPAGVTATENCLSPKKQFLAIDGTSVNSKKLNGKVQNASAVGDTLVLRDGSGRGVFTNVVLSQALSADNANIVNELLNHCQLALRDGRDNTFRFITKVSLERWLTKASLTATGLVKLSNNTEGSSSSLAATEKAVGDVNRNTKRVSIHNPSTGYTVSRNAAVTTVIFEENATMAITIDDGFIDGDEVILHRMNAPTTQLSVTCGKTMSVYFPNGKVDGNNHVVTGTCKLHLTYIASESRWTIQVLTG